MRIFGLFFFIIALASSQLASSQQVSYTGDIVSNNCIQFTVSSGTGCAWMCSYCANNLGTNNYYFPDSVCTYQDGQGCVGNPIAGKIYTCCSTN
jgi:hypothetical protein